MTQKLRLAMPRTPDESADGVELAVAHVDHVEQAEDDGQPERHQDHGDAERHAVDHLGARTNCA